MTEPTIFDNQETLPEDKPTVVDTPPAPTIPQELVELVGEGKKYATLDEALKSVPYAQKHIANMKTELAAAKQAAEEAKTELEKRQTAEDILNEIKSGINPQEKPSGDSLTQDTVEQIVSSVLSKHEQEAVTKANSQKVVEAFDKQFGEKAEEVYTALAQEAGLSVQMMNQLAATSPQAIFKMVGFEQKETPAARIQPTVNTDAVKPSDNSNLSARVPVGASTREVTERWRNAGKKVGKQT